MAKSTNLRLIRSRRAVLRAGLRAVAVALVGVSFVRSSCTCSAFSTLSGRNTPGGAAQSGNLRLARIRVASRGGEACVKYEVGDQVKAQCRFDREWYPGLVEKINDDGTLAVKWDDPDGGPTTNDVYVGTLRKVSSSAAVVRGSDVRAMHPDARKFFPGVVTRVYADGTFIVKWDDPGDGPRSHEVKRESVKKVTVCRDYQVGDAVEALFPADVLMCAGTVAKANDDGTFTVKWDEPADGIEQTACSPKQMRHRSIPFDMLKVGDKYRGTVKQIVEFGAFVDIGADVDGLLHKSEISSGPVVNVRNYLEEGQVINVWICSLTGKRKLGLTMLEGRLEKT